MGQMISPPPLKKRKLEPKSTSATTKGAHGGKDLRIFAWNINGITPFLPVPQTKISSFFQSSPPKKTTQRSRPVPESGVNQQHQETEGRPKASLRDFLRRHGWPHLLLLQEVKIAPDDSSTQSAVRRAVAVSTRAKVASADKDRNRRSSPSPPPEPDYEAHFVLPTDPHNAKGFGRKVHGVCSIVRSDFAREAGLVVRTVDWDAEGRFSILETEGRNGWPKLSVWNVYAVNGTDFDYRSSETGEIVGTRHDRKLAVHGLMAEEVTRLEAEKYHVILAGDMNVARDERDGFPRLRTKPYQHVVNRKDFVEKLFNHDHGLGMVDSFREMTGEETRAYTYYPRNSGWGESCDRVDYVLCSKTLRSQLVDAGMLDNEAERGPSDHVPIFAAFSFGAASDVSPEPSAE